ncbi:MAG: hypothetical protein KAY32_12740 [Candidatus Eisenbacteria sp.]|nr:hypothetical protein [Candidatus Eisenbacteria bacterium]
MDRPEEMTAEQRLREVAAILAAGYLRLWAADPPPDKPLDCPAAPKRPLGLTQVETEAGR